MPVVEIGEGRGNENTSGEDFSLLLVVIAVLIVIPVPLALLLPLRFCTSCAYSCFSKCAMYDLYSFSLRRYSSIESSGEEVMPE